MSVERRRGIYCNRTLNFGRVRAIGYDMDYTLIHYRMEAWERHAYDALKRRLVTDGWPIEDLEFDPTFAVRGLVIDAELGNVVKANRFGFIKRAYHGTERMPFADQRATYARTLIDLRDHRWRFMNTLFSISEGCLFMQLVAKFDAGELVDVASYAELHQRIRGALDWAHEEGALKASILADPGRFVELEEETALALLDQKHAGKMLFLITNSEWSYAAPMMTFAFDPYLPDGMTWRDLFDLVIVGARKPNFFSTRMPTFSVESDDGLLRDHTGALVRGGAYVGGNAALVERSFGLAGEQILYVGDHIFSDVNVSKSIQRWRTALILRELESEVDAIDRFAPRQAELTRLMAEKTAAEAEFCTLRLELQRNKVGYGPKGRKNKLLEDAMRAVRERIVALDEQVGPLAIAAGQRANERWGLLMRTGNDKSHLARQVERYADVYTSRVSNFLLHTPFLYLRSPQGSLPHDS